MRVAICDDSRGICLELENIIESYKKAQGYKIDLEIFYQGEQLIRYLQTQETIDVLFLDVELPDINGIEIGKYIREELKNEQMFIIYISSYEEYSIHLFQNRPLDFLIKPLNEKIVKKKLEYVFEMKGRKYHFFEYHNYTRIIRIPYKDILYFQSKGKKIEIITVYGKEWFYEKLDIVQKTVSDTCFFRIHKSYLVNNLHVIQHYYEHIKMSNQDILNISKKYRAEIRHLLMNKEEQ